MWHEVNAYTLTSDFAYFHTTTKRTINELISVNATSATHLTRMILPKMIQKNRGAVVYVSSSDAILPSPYTAVFAAANCFVEKLYESLRYEYCGTRIVFQCLNPILWDNRMSRAVNDKRDDEFAQKYAHNAIDTLGWCDNATGYWLFSLRVNIHFILIFNHKIWWLNLIFVSKWTDGLVASFAYVHSELPLLFVVEREISLASITKPILSYYQMPFHFKIKISNRPHNHFFLFFLELILFLLLCLFKNLHSQHFNLF